jgi:hypothetical protein
MGSGISEVIEDGLLGAAGIPQSIGQDGETIRAQAASGQEALVLGSARQRDDRGRLASLGECDGTEGAHSSQLDFSGVMEVPFVPATLSCLHLPRTVLTHC